MVFVCQWYVDTGLRLSHTTATAPTLAYKETFGVNINKAYIIRSSKDLQFSEYLFKDLKEGKREFKYLRQIYRRVKGK